MAIENINTNLDAETNIDWIDGGEAVSATIINRPLQQASTIINSNFADVQTQLSGKLSTTGKAADANLLDGLNSSSFLRSDTSASTSGDLAIIKNNPWLTLDSSSGGANGVEQAAGISIGESGKKGDAALHLTYTGDGKGWIGMGNVSSTTSIPDHWVMSLQYQSNNVTFRETPNVNGNTVWHAGNDGPGSGLNADLLDGLNSSSFMRRIANSTLDMNNNDITGVDQIFHHGDTNTFMQFHAEDQWRVVTGGGERLEVNNSQITAAVPIKSNSYTESAGFASNGGTGLYLTAPGGGTYKNLSSSQTGYIKIKLPQSWTNTMMKFRISVFDYAENESFDVIVAGYNATSGSTWTRTSATIISDNSVNRNFNVRFGHDGTKCSVYIGESNSVWGYPQIAVTEFHGGYTNFNTSQWNNGWEISITPTLGTITSTQTGTELGRYIDNSTVWHAGNDGPGSGLNADLLDGLNSSSFLRSDTSDSFSRNSGIMVFQNNNNIINSSSGSLGALEVNQPTSGKDAFMTYHISGQYATYFGLSGAFNDFVVGGWSAGANRYRVYHEGNRQSLGIQTRKIIYRNTPATFTLNKSNMGNNGLVQLYSSGAGSIVSVDTSTFETGSTITIKINNEGTTFRLKNLDDRIYLPDATSVAANVEVTVSKACTIELEKPTGSNWLMLQIH